MEVKVRLNSTAQRAFYKFLATSVFLIGGLLLPGAVLAQETVSYKNYEDITISLKNLVKSNPQIAKLESIGKTAGVRDIWLLTLGNTNGISLDERPGILLAGNAEADHIVGSALSLGIIERLINGYGNDESITKSLNDHVIYCLPRINPDGAELYFESVKKGLKTNTTPYDGDNDGRIDEDGPDDLNGDGFITMMRVKDPAGEYCLDPNNENLLKKADPAKGETGIYKVFWEGLDNDGDGFINEDPIGGTDINRNFAHEYPYYQADAGVHMVCELETRAVMDWIIQQRNIGIILSFSQTDNLLSPPNAKGQLSSDRGLDLVGFANASNKEAGKVGMISTRRSYGRYGMGRFSFMSRGTSQQQSSRPRRPARKAATTYNKADLTYFTKVSNKYKELTGIKTAPILRDPKGALSEYGYFQYGVLSLTTPGWGLPESQDTAKKASQGMRRGSGGSQAAGRMSSKNTDAEYYKYLNESSIAGFIAWEKVDHPDFDAVEVGGFTPYEIVNPDPDKVSDLVDSHTDFVIYLSSLFGKVVITKTEAINHGDGLFRIKAEVRNEGFLPTSLQHGVLSRSVKPTMVRLEVEPEQIISGNAKTNFFQQLEGSGKQRSYEWLIKGKKGDEIKLKVVSQKAGSDTVIIKLK
ncbi:MAG: M14 family metallopeptidase [Bacteroidota bacterium]|nr:M14 family metallopeptidase [Bacteroidota bacterium]